MAKYSKGQKVEFMPHGLWSKPHDGKYLIKFNVFSLNSIRSNNLNVASTKGYHNYEHAGYIIDLMTDRGGGFIGEYAVNSPYPYVRARLIMDNKGARYNSQPR